MTNMRKVELDPEAVRNARRAAGVTISELAEESEIPRGTVAAIEARPRLALDRAKRLARALGVAVRDICRPAPAAKE